jgi:hypothetical protein
MTESESPKRRAWNANMQRLIRAGGVRIEAEPETPVAFTGVVHKVPRLTAAQWRERRAKAAVRRAAKAART